jgi:uncharacterized tellurite resistance protein B-like protein
MVIDAIKRLFEGALPQELASEVAPEREHALRLATAALLFEIVRADGKVQAAERTVMRAAVQSTFDLSGDELEDLMTLAESASRQAASLYEFTQPMDVGFSPEQKTRIVELLWLVAFADADKAPLEEHLIRKVAGLLHVSHPDFIDAKLRAKAARA